MRSFVRRAPTSFAREIRETVRRPRRLAHLVDRRAWRGLAHRLSSPDPGDWGMDEGLYRRRYETYDDYVAHQRSKLALLDLAAYNAEFRQALRARLRAAPVDWAGKSVLCLAARLGAEVEAFHDLGAFAVGIDLEPGARNALVLPGDFHHLQFPSGCVEVVYTNSLDHALDLRALVEEMRRVLVPDGLAVIEPTEAGRPGERSWEASGWDSVDRVIGLFDEGFELTFRQPIDFPTTHVEQLIFARSPD